VTSKNKIKMKKALHVNSGPIIFKSKHIGCRFCSDFQGVLEGSQRFCPHFRGFCPDFTGFCPDFHQIKTFGVRLHPLHSQLLHQWKQELLPSAGPKKV